MSDTIKLTRQQLNYITDYIDHHRGMNYYDEGIIWEDEYCDLYMKAIDRWNRGEKKPYVNNEWALQHEEEMCPAYPDCHVDRSGCLFVSDGFKHLIKLRDEENYEHFSEEQLEERVSQERELLKEEYKPKNKIIIRYRKTLLHIKYSTIAQKIKHSFIGRHLGYMLVTLHNLWLNIYWKIFPQTFVDEHLGCFSYPNCDLSPTGCFHTGLSYDEMDHFGHRD